MRWCPAGSIWLDPTSGKGWTSWVFFPNTGTLRNQYNTDTGLGYPQCLTVVSSSS